MALTEPGLGGLKSAREWDDDCEQLERLLRRAPGVESCAVSGAGRSARLRIDRAHASVRTLVGAAADLGFRATITLAEDQGGSATSSLSKSRDDEVRSSRVRDFFP